MEGIDFEKSKIVNYLIFKCVFFKAIIRPCIFTIILVELQIGESADAILCDAFSQSSSHNYLICESATFTQIILTIFSRVFGIKAMAWVLLKLPAIII